MVILSSWREAFETTIRELELANRKREALRDLLERNRMSRSTYDYLIRELEDEIGRFRDHMRVLAKRMNERISELHRQERMLERFLAWLELMHIGEEIDEEKYNYQRDAFMSGLDATRSEIRQIEEALRRISITEKYK